jgi:hypothetical protein
VPPDILARAELGDHFETINPDRPDTQSAFGNPDAQMFHSVQGNTEAEGGGGCGGSALSDSLIGAGGGGSPGEGGGWGGGKGTGTGVGAGSGHGSFGNRSGGGRKLMVKRHGGSKATEGAVDAALRWLAYHQEKEGHWVAGKYLDNKNIRHGGRAEWSRTYDPGVSGLATLAFLGAGHTLKVGEYKNNVQRAIAWFLSQQDAEGNFAAKHGQGHDFRIYCHCIATLACAEALGMNGGKDFGEYSDKQPTLRTAVEKGVALILKWQTQNPQGGWSYPATGPVDPTVTGWAVMALKSAKIAGVVIPPESFLKAREAMLQVTEIDKAKSDYGQTSVGYRAKKAFDFGSKGYACTAAGMVINLFMGMAPGDDLIQGAAGFITQEDALPAWTFKPESGASDHQNLYYWYYGTLGCFQAGGDTWKKWNVKMKDALIPNQRKDGDASGSWNPDDVWGAWGGRVYSTALGALCLEVYYRYVKLNGDQ